MLFSVTEKVKFIEHAFGKGNLERSGVNINVRCPIPTCSSRKDKSKRKLAIRITDDANHCWVCGWAARSLLPLLRKYSDSQTLLKYVEKYCQTNVNKSNIAITSDDVNKQLTLPADFKAIVTKSNDPDVKAVSAYLSSRGLSSDDLWYFKFGTSNEPRWYRRALFPSFDDTGHLNYFTGRSIDPRKRPKYDNPNVPTNDVVFNEINIDWSSPLIICEGPFDLVKCPQNSTCLLGSSLSMQSLLFERLLQHDTPVILALDSDASKKVRWIANFLTEYALNVSVMSLGDRNDPGEMSKKEFLDASLQAKPWSWETSMMTQVSRLNTRMSVA